jgi:Protein of unknown function (DUF3298)
LAKYDYQILTKEYSANLETRATGSENNSCKSEYLQISISNKDVETKINQTLLSKNECENIKDINTNQGFEINYRNNKFLSLKKCGSHYYKGAAHGMYGCQNFNLDLETGENLTLEKLVKKENFGQISESLLKNYQKQVKERSENPQTFPAEVGKTKPWTEDGKIPVGVESNFSITKDKLVLFFGEYELGSYAEGSYELEIPISNIQNLLTDKWNIVKI